uniref:FAD-binding PCMH-type domain-containing protein n=1 Tax=Arion vulgaris TaxID=1028688 RepID=A0A0B7AAS5_9EUPU
MKDAENSIVFSVNGKPYTVRNEYPMHTSLLDFLRSSGVSSGTKGCCLEGGCGICLVTVQYVDNITEKPTSYSINSCCLQLYSCDGLEITTVEGLGSTSSGIHPIQDRLATFNGAQCGYCSPGQVMNMYGLLKNNARPNMKEVEDAFDTTICRCTGYRPILDAMKSFAIDAPTSPSGGIIDIEELDGKVCCRKGKLCTDFPKNRGKLLEIITDQNRWYRPVKLPQLINLLEQYSTEKYRLVFGNTGFGFFSDQAVTNYTTLIDIRGVKELYSVDLDDKSHITFGANLTLTNLKEQFESINDPDVPYAKEFADHLLHVGSTGIRNMGSWAGNLMLKHVHNEFPSDVFTMLETVGATIKIVGVKETNKNYSLLDFLSLNMNGKVIVSIQLPKYKTQNIIIRTFKTSPRRQLSLPHVSSGFNFQIDISKDYLVEKRPTIIIQGISASLVHASQTEVFLTNKKLSDPAVLREAIQILSVELQPISVSSCWQVCSTGRLWP